MSTCEVFSLGAYAPVVAVAVALLVTGIYYQITGVPK